MKRGQSIGFKRQTEVIQLQSNKAILRDITKKAHLIHTRATNLPTKTGAIRKTFKKRGKEHHFDGCIVNRCGWSDNVVTRLKNSFDCPLR